MSLERAVQRTIINQGIVPYEQQTPEQKRELIGRVSSLLDIRVLRAKILDNWAYIEGSIPLNPKNHELKILRQRLNRIKKMFREDMVPFAKESERVLNLCLTASGHGTDELDLAAHFASEFLNNVHTVSVDKLELLKEVSQAIVDETFTAMSEGQSDKEMLDFANYCISLSGRKKITANDLKKFRKNGN